VLLGVPAGDQDHPLRRGVDPGCRRSGSLQPEVLDPRRGEALRTAVDGHQAGEAVLRRAAENPGDNAAQQIRLNGDGAPRPAIGQRRQQGQRIRAQGSGDRFRDVAIAQRQYQRQVARQRGDLRPGQLLETDDLRHVRFSA